MKSKLVFHQWWLEYSSEYGPGLVGCWAGNEKRARQKCEEELHQRHPSGNWTERSFVMSETSAPARIWFWAWQVSDDKPFVLILAPNERWTDETRGHHEEGYSDSFVSYEYDAAEGVVIQERSSHSSDCDGPHESHSEYVCSINDLDLHTDMLSLPEERDPDYACWEHCPYIEEISFPDWQKKSAYQRDRFAEAAGY